MQQNVILQVDLDAPSWTLFIEFILEFRNKKYV